MSRIDELNRFYSLIAILCERSTGYRYLRDCTSKSGWPERGVYFFFENGENRDDGLAWRVTRVGTHAITASSSTSLWDRLRTHRGHLDRSGNHRGSIFRKRIGEALLQVRQYPDEICQTWSVGNSAPKSVCLAESLLEQDVSRYIGDMPFLWVEVNDAPSPTSRRAYIERSCIAMLSNFEKPPIDAPSAKWLGSYSPQLTIRQSGLWNTNHVNEPGDPAFLDELSNLVTDLGK